MNDIRDFIAENRRHFDREPLPNGHEERFFAKLPQHVAPKSGSMPLRQILGVAASVTIIVLGGLGINELSTAPFITHIVQRHQIKVEAKMQQKFQKQIEIIEQEINNYASSMAPSDWDEIEYTLVHLAQNRNLLLEVLPQEAPFALRRAALKDYYDQNLDGMQQIASLLAHNQFHTY